MDGNPRVSRKWLIGLTLICAFLLMALVIFLHNFVGDYVAEDIQGRLVPVTVILMIPLVIGLILWVIWLTGKDRTRGYLKAEEK